MIGFYCPADQKNCVRDCIGCHCKGGRLKDLTPRQIEWCKAWIPAFNPKVAT